MSHYAQLDENGVVVFVIHAKSDGKEEEFSARLGQTWKQTSYNTRGGVHYDPATGEPSEDQTKALRFNYAGLGYQYDPDRDAFIPPKPFESWVLDETTCLWVAPVPMPEETDENGDPVPYTWDESVGEWMASE